MIRTLSIVFVALLGLVLLAAAPVKAAGESSLAQRLAGADYVLMMRHADAPGVGDPAGYTLADCGSQRNLGERGRRQAVAIGDWLRAQGVTDAAVYTSPWCRCKDTAQGLALGNYQVEPALGSFFETPAQAAAQTRELSQFLARTLPGKGARALILVTHHVNIREFVAENVGTGDMVLVRVNRRGEYISHTRHRAPG